MNEADNVMVDTMMVNKICQGNRVWDLLFSEFPTLVYIDFQYIRIIVNYLSRYVYLLWYDGIV
jgi:hypothetical protein